MNVEPTDLIWMNGEFVAWEDAKVHVLTHGLHYGTGVFEGVRCYDTEIGPATAGTIGIAASGNINPERTAPSIFEPVHGSAPDIAGQGIANPLAMVLSTAMLLEHGLGRLQEAAAVESAVHRALQEGLRTRDLGGTASTAEAARTVLAHLQEGD